MIISWTEKNGEHRKIWIRSVNLINQWMADAMELYETNEAIEFLLPRSFLFFSPQNTMFFFYWLEKLKTTRCLLISKSTLNMQLKRAANKTTTQPIWIHRDLFVSVCATRVLLECSHSFMALIKLSASISENKTKIRFEQKRWVLVPPLLALRPYQTIANSDWAFIAGIALAEKLFATENLLDANVSTNNVWHLDLFDELKMKIERCVYQAVMGFFSIYTNLFCNFRSQEWSNNCASTFFHWHRVDHRIRIPNLIRTKDWPSLSASTHAIW